MTTAQEIIQQAYREGNLLPVGKDPTDAELTEGLGRLNGLILGYLGHGIGEMLHDWMAPQPQRTAPVAANYPQGPQPDDMPAQVYLYPPKNQRVLWNGTTQTVYFPEQPDDGSRMAVARVSGAWNEDPDTPLTTLTFDGNGRTIEGAATLAFTNDTTPIYQWFYRADLGDWKRVETLALTDEMLFPPDCDDLWILMLSVRLAGRYGKSLSKESVAVLKQAQSYARQKFTQHQVTTYGADQFPNTAQAYGEYPWAAGAGATP